MIRFKLEIDHQHVINIKINAIFVFNFIHSLKKSLNKVYIYA